jgi:hypothetical protein
MLRFALALSLLHASLAQQIGTNQAENHPSLV